MTTVARPPAAVDLTLRDPGFGATLRSEWTKFTSQRSTRVTLVLGTLLGMTVTGLVGWLVLATWDEWPAEERAAFVPLDAALIGMLVTGLLFAVLGVTAVSAEYSSRMAMLTFTVTPRRGRVLLAKVLVVGGVTAVATAVAVTGMILVSLAVFSGLDRPSPDAGRMLRVVLGVALNAGLFPVIGVAMTFVLRSAAGSVAALLAVSFGPAVFGPLLPRWWAEHGERYLPTAAVDSLTLPSFPDAADQLDRGVAAVVVALWLAVFLGAALAVLERRDV